MANDDDDDVDDDIGDDRFNSDLFLNLKVIFIDVLCLLLFSYYYFKNYMIDRMMIYLKQFIWH